MKLLAAVLCFSLVAATALAQTADDRTPLCLNSQQQQVLLTEMRGLLSAVQNIHLALAKDDFPLVAEHARSVGMAMVNKAEGHEHGLMQSLPEDFRRLGMSVHKDFDQMASMADTKPDTKAVLGELGAIMGKCVACHATYKAVTDKDGCK